MQGSFPARHLASVDAIKQRQSAAEGRLLAALNSNLNNLFFFFWVGRHNTAFTLKDPLDNCTCTGMANYEGLLFQRLAKRIKTFASCNSFRPGAPEACCLFLPKW